MGRHNVEKEAYPHRAERIRHGRVRSGPSTSENSRDHTRKHPCHHTKAQATSWTVIKCPSCMHMQLDAASGYTKRALRANHGKVETTHHKEQHGTMTSILFCVVK